MTTLAIRARFPLGVFQGRRPDGATRDPWPDVARLHGALLHAASKGSEAEVRNGDLRATRQSLAALTWLERHPPVAMSLPDVIPTHGEPIISYRDKGSFKKKSDAGYRNGVLPDRMDCRTALSGDVGWRWERVPDEHAELITKLCHDVACLGQVESPVILEVGDLPVTHRKDGSSTQLTPRGALLVRCPGTGRTEALERQYDSVRRGEPPSTDSASKGQQSVSPPPVDRCTQNVHYASVSRPVEQHVPWSRVLLFAGAGSMPWQESLAWCVAFHRTLAARAGDGAPPIITGSYPKGQAHPANRLAIQVIDESWTPYVNKQDDKMQGAAFALLVPEEMTARETALLQSITAGRLSLRVRGRTINLNPAGEVQGDEFWKPPAAGLTRLWATSPAMVSETRPQPPRDGRNWTFREAAWLAVAFVMRESLSVDATGSRRYWDRVDAVRDKGVEVLSANRITDSRVERYAYKLPRGVVAQPFSATLNLGDLVPPTALLAVGQSRHVGGGLLVPVDVPEHVAEGRQ